MPKRDMSYRMIATKVDKKVETRKERITVEFKPDFLKDRLMVELINSDREIKHYEEIYECMSVELIPEKNRIKIEALKLYRYALSCLMVL